jgi:Amt family ammonium transporter
MGAYVGGFEVAWLLLGGFLLLLVLAGLALIAAGLNRAKNSGHTMAMNLAAFAIGVLGVFICGFALAIGGLGGGGRSLSVHLGSHSWVLVGGRYFFLASTEGIGSPPATALLVPFTMLLALACAIPIGALAERWKFRSLCATAALLGGVVYPVFACWVWGGGWIAQLGSNCGLGLGGFDFAGGGVIHMQAGVVALIGALVLGPRIGKYDATGRPKPIFGHHMPMVFLGTLLFALGWLGYLAALAIARDRAVAAGTIAINALIACAAGVLVACAFMWRQFGKPDPTMMCSGLMASLVASSAGAPFVAPWAALLIGVGAGVLVCVSVVGLEKSRIDDPAGVISVHGVGGLWGVLAAGLFADGVHGRGLLAPDAAPVGLFYGGVGQFLAQLILALVGIVWVGVAAGLLFFVLGKIFGGNRVAPDVEVAGLDLYEMGSPAYPDFIASLDRRND